MKRQVNLIKKIEIDSEKMKRMTEETYKNDFSEVEFSFIGDHCGFRSGKIHVLLGTSGSGKSTLSRAILRQCTKTQKVLYYSTEETLDDVTFFFGKNGVEQSELDNIYFSHENDMLEQFENSNHRAWIDELFKNAITEGLGLIMIDNISTSDFYDSQGKKQSEIINYLGQMAKDTGIPVFIIIHTPTGIKSDQQALIQVDDIRGNRNLANKAEYFYIYQTFTTTNSMGNQVINPFVRVAKSRLHDNSGKIYFLYFSSEKKTYIRDTETTFEDFNKAFKNRNILGQPVKKQEY